MEFTFDELYGWMKGCLDAFDLQWGEKNKMKIKTTNKFISAKYKNEEIIWHYEEVE
jgi:hypothetical protein